MPEPLADGLDRLCRGDASRRVLVVAAHPDDEVIGAGARLAALGEGFVLHVTDGAPRDAALRSIPGCSRLDYARRRREEAIAALALAGVGEERLVSFGVVDGDAIFELPFVVRSLVDLVRRLAPELIVTHPYEGGHPDHDACALAVRLATRLLERQRGRGVEVVEMASYHDEAGEPVRLRFLTAAGSVERALVLSPRERALKRAMFDAHASQQRVLEAFPLDVERFRTPPPYDFRAAPHPGRLGYERMGWLTGERFVALAGRALAALE